MPTQTPEQIKNAKAMRDALAKAAENVETGGELVKWEKSGEKVAGTVLGFRQISTELGDDIVADLRELESGETVTMFCSPYEIKNALQAYRVQTNDTVYFEHTKTDDLGGGKKVKRFKVAVMRDGKILERPRTTYAAPLSNVEPPRQLDGTAVPVPPNPVQQEIETGPVPF